MKPRLALIGLADNALEVVGGPLQIYGPTGSIRIPPLQNVYGQMYQHDPKQQLILLFWSAGFRGEAKFQLERVGADGMEVVTGHTLDFVSDTLLAKIDLPAQIPAGDCLYEVRLDGEVVGALVVDVVYE